MLLFSLFLDQLYFFVGNLWAETDFATEIFLNTVFRFILLQKPFVFKLQLWILW